VRHSRGGLNAGDGVVFFSDGLVEACDACDEFFGDARLEQLLVASPAGAPERFRDQIIAELRRGVGRTRRFRTT
jgi:serine phosphatase RsbU (regulator of sigma subunit)